MSIGDQAQNKAEEIGSKAKDVIGDATGDRSMQAGGKADQAGANLKQAGTKAADAVTDGHGVINRLHRAGFRSEYAYIGGFTSIGVSLVSWFISRNKTGDDKAQSDRWGIFVGHWAPTFMALGVALKLEEDR